MSLGPFFRLPFTDLTGCMVNHQHYSRCAGFEMKMMDCLEAYGVERGKEKCKTLIEDFKECALRTKQKLRIREMRLERHRQYFAGERPREELYAKPPTDDSF
ncbi:NADH dehydrogenase [ubiquinone] iron-sulfur protein 5 [Schistocerca americana]|uniref:NADH dehydrogenase [ubiquinone] iron-sulfur protein 5 n=1 Tax=Schistocerca americana TaxID=7009 RepID=UPI001F4F86DD|nr:NADH dehydrogenase [ubiquinone] iron-sulfur protein 5 [Schistocerca americana]XP_047117632.1 NADH dehydrogenase [ubiquinone] iron-sulfur protein 5 [Schistocerca piceifrons]XP_049815057.1 NADH dehydrogenase [ubiquinone] iron-sulfur protein 5 [Schistocerca nitens]XP_049831135.1 NADH dehydrogenase [ubiquinone] iron-sulfur protein 5 [Schistocerca gregaria]XP_049964030.1 NADH dehydrogenase [ubiquinone] iron-sulfur protein 5 [Schistocerca serialis cubense]XP_049964031.1 NADH dehydrogenase [ubiqui